MCNPVSFFSICPFLLSVFLLFFSATVILLHPLWRSHVVVLKCCLEMFPGAFTRGNSVVFSLGEACWYCSWPCPHCSLATSNHTHKLTHLLPWMPSFGCLVTCFHLDVILNIWYPRATMEKYCTVFHLSLAFTLPLICIRLIFTACLSPPPLLLKQRVFRLFCVETESSKACLLQRNRYQYHSVVQ